MAGENPWQGESFPGNPDELARRVLHLASAEIPRSEFFWRVCALLAAELRTRSLSLWLIGRPRWLRLDFSPEYFKVSRFDAPGENSVSVLCRKEKFRAEGWEHGVLTLRRQEKPEAEALTLIPLLSGDQTAGWLGFEAPDPVYLARREADALLRVSETLAIALEQQRLLSALRERVKELTCTHGIARLAESSASLETILGEIVALLPPALQFPEHAAASLQLDGRIHGQIPGRMDARLSKGIQVAGVSRGSLVISYDREFPDPETFLPEEEDLLKTVARQISALVEKHETREEREKLEAQLRHADRLATIGTLSAGVAHELNEPLGAILGFAQLAAGVEGLPAGVADDLAKIEEASLHAREIVRQLMLFARKEPSRSRPVSLADILNSAVSLVSSRFRDSSVRLDLQVSAKDAVILGDSASLQQVVINLLVNAVQSMPGGGELKVRSWADTIRVFLEVRDTGMGMSERVRERLFVPFFTTKEVNEGTGLGLAVVHGIVSAHGGKIEVESAEGKGSSFLISFPRYRGEEREAGRT